MGDQRFEIGSHKQSDFHEFVNNLGGRIDESNKILELIGSTLQDLKKKQDADIRHTWRTVSIGGDTVQVGFKMMSVYVDNSNNANTVTIKPSDGSGVFTVPANAQQWIPLLGAEYFDTSGTAAHVPMMIVDTFLPIK